MICLLKEDIMNKKCIGCGATLQTINTEEVGYVKEQNLEKSSLCERCFRIRNYGDYDCEYSIESEGVINITIF